MIVQHAITVIAAMGILMLAIFTAIDASAGSEVAASYNIAIR